MNPYNDAAPSKPRTSSSAVAPGTSIRPRTKRFITGLEHFAEGGDSTTNASGALGSPTASYYESPLDSRAASPIPSKHPSRSSSLRPTASRNANGSASLSPGGDLAASLSGIWGKSWTSLQGLASNVLGNDLTDPIKDNPNAPRKPRSRHSPNASAKWGPSVQQNQLGGGSNEERKAMVRAKQRQDMLIAGRGDTDLNNPALLYKRRTSDEFESSSAPPGNHDNRDALVYIHQVAPQDTLPGISIKFNCPMAAIKKSNGMWSNDGIQARKNIIIPVDACNIKGKRVAEPTPVSPSPTNDDNSKTPTQASVDWANDPRWAATSTVKTALSTATGDFSTAGEDNPWTHESWIMIEGHSNAVEIARLPRQNLGYFPKARRKSNPQSDLGSPSSASLDQARPSIAISDSSSSTTRHPLHHRSRRSSGSQDFARQMIGPGGVGTLKGKGPSAPGPAEDKLNKVFGKSLGGISPREPSLEDGTQAFDYFSAGVSLDNFGNAIQGWVNRLAKGASKAMEPSPPTSSSYSYVSRQRNPRSQRSVHGEVSATSTGDLIELSNAFEIGEEEDESEYIERGRDRTPTNGRLFPVKESPNVWPSTPRPESEPR